MQKHIVRLLALLSTFGLPALALAQGGVAPAMVSPFLGGGSGGSTTAAAISAALYCADAGATDAYACDLATAPTYTAGLCANFKANTANTGAASINFNSLGAKTIVKVVGGVTTALANNDIRVSQVVTVCYDGTNFQMQSTLGAAPAGGGDALTTDPLSQFAATTSAQFAGVISNETGTGLVVLNDTPTLATPNLTGVTTGASLDLSAMLTTENGVNYCADAGANDTYACSLSPAITAYVTGSIYYFKANTANTGAATLNLNTIGAKTIVKTSGGVTTALSDNDIRAGSFVQVIYDGTNLQLISPVANAGGSGSPGGSDTQVQFNDGGSFGGDADLVWNKTTNLLTNAGIFGGADSNAPVFARSNNTAYGWGFGASGELSSWHAGVLSLDVTQTGIRPGANGSQQIGDDGRAWTQLFLDETITGAGTTGAQTINKAAGTVNFAAGATSIVVTNSLVDTSSLIFTTMRTADTTCTFVKSVVPASGSFTITVNVGCAAETSVGFFVLN